MTVTTFIALGSNLNDPRQQLQTAVRKLHVLPQTKCIKVSNFYWNKPLGNLPQPDYLNAVAKLMTTLEPLALLKALQGIERDQGRKRKTQQRKVRWPARPLDLDMILYGDLKMNSADLTLPHPEMAKRPFVLFPLAEIAPDLVLPDGTALQGLLCAHSKTELVVDMP